MLMALTVCKSGFLLTFFTRVVWHVLYAGIISMAEVLPNLFSGCETEVEACWHFFNYDDTNFTL